MDLSVPNKGTGSPQDLVLAHQQAIIACAIKVFNRTWEAFYLSDKGIPPWKDRAAVVAYMLDRDTKATASTIAAQIGCTVTKVPSLIQHASDAITNETPHMLQLLESITDTVNEKLADDEMVWHRSLSASALEKAKTDPLLERVLKQAEAVIGISAAAILGTARAPEVVAARYAAIGVYWFLAPKASLDFVAKIFQKSLATPPKACRRLYRALRGEIEDEYFRTDAKQLMAAMGITDQSAFVDAMYDRGGRK